MNEQLRNELNNAMNIMYDIETNILEENKQYRKQIQELNNEYNKIKGGDPQKGVQTFAIVLLVLAGFGFVAAFTDSPEMRESTAKRMALLIGTLVIMIVLIVLNLMRIKVSQQHKKNRADKWWKTNAQNKVAELNNNLKYNNELISALVSGNPILAEMPRDILSGLTVYQLKSIVEQGRAYTLAAAYDVWYDDRETRRYREEMRENMETIQQNQRELQGALDRANQNLSDIAFQEEMLYWELKSK